MYYSSHAQTEREVTAESYSVNAARPFFKCSSWIERASDRRMSYIDPSLRSFHLPLPPPPPCCFFSFRLGSWSCLRTMLRLDDPSVTPVVSGILLASLLQWDERNGWKWFKSERGEVDLCAYCFWERCICWIVDLAEGRKIGNNENFDLALSLWSSEVGDSQPPRPEVLWGGDMKVAQRVHLHSARSPAGGGGKRESRNGSSPDWVLPHQQNNWSGLTDGTWACFEICFDVVIVGGWILWTVLSCVAERFIYFFLTREIFFWLNHASSGPRCEARRKEPRRSCQRPAGTSDVTTHPSWSL